MSYGMKRLERIRTVQHDTAVRDLSDVDHKIEASKVQLSAVAAQMLEDASSGSIDVHALMDADLARRAIENRIKQLAAVRVTRSQAETVAAMDKKQAEMLAHKSHEAMNAERDDADARAMDEMSVQIWRRS